MWHDYIDGEVMQASDTTVAAWVSLQQVQQLSAIHGDSRKWAQQLPRTGVVNTVPTNTPPPHMRRGSQGTKEGRASHQSHYKEGLAAVV